jgi:hypothetical protein
MRAESSASPDFQLCAKSAKLSFRDLTSRVTVVIAPPFYISHEVGDQTIDIDKNIRTLGLSDVHVIALAGFIIVPKDAHAIRDQSEPIFESMAACRNGAWHFPQYEFGEHAFGQDNAAIEDQFRLHVGLYDNI